MMVSCHQCHTDIKCPNNIFVFIVLFRFFCDTIILLLIRLRVDLQEFIFVSTSSTWEEESFKTVSASIALFLIRRSLLLLQLNVQFFMLISLGEQIRKISGSKTNKTFQYLFCLISSVEIWLPESCIILLVPQWNVNKTPGYHRDVLRPPTL